MIKNIVLDSFVLGNVRFHSNDENKSPPPPASDSSNQNRPISPRMEEFQQKLRAKTPIGRLGELGSREKQFSNKC